MKRKTTLADHQWLWRITVALWIAFFCQSAWGAISVFVSPSVSNVPQAESVSVDIRIANAINIRAASLTVTFDNNVLRYNSYSKGAFLSGPDPDGTPYSTLFFATPPGPTVNSILVDQAILGPGGVSGDGTLVTLEFIALEPGSTELTISAVELIDTNNDQFVPTTRSGEVNVDSPVPIQLVSFTGRLVASHGVLLEWKTVSEINNYGFEVQRSAGGSTNYETLTGSFVAGHGTTNVPQFYSFVDCQPAAGSSYYRLKQIDLDGAAHYSEGIRVDVLANVKNRAPTEFTLYQNYPNPFNPTTEITFTVESTRRTVLHVYNVLGEQVAVLFDDVAESGRYYRVNLDAATLAGGTYLFRLQSGNRFDVKKMILLK